jgi:two-component system, NtrC family, sensor kinase
MRKFFKDMYSAPFQLVLVISFSLVAALAIIVGAWTISRTISEYLAGAMDERVARDMQLALSDYDLMLREIAGTTLRLSRDPTLGENLAKIGQGDQDAIQNIDQQVAVKFIGSALGGNRLIAVINQDGDLLAGQLLSTDGVLSKVNPSQGWQNLDIIQKAMTSGQSLAATEVIDAELLAKVGLDEQARIAILDTPKAAPELYDSREGTAGLALVSASPIWDEQRRVAGAVLAMHLFNNDFTLVDRIKEMAGIDTATIFLGDLRASTNVMTLQGERAIGTRLSQEVSDVVLNQGKEYTGPAFVVNENYITRYDPLEDHTGKRIGILYVGAKQASFYTLVNTFNQRIVLVALGMMLLTFILTTPVSRVITRPLEQIRDLVVANRRVAEGDMSVRVSTQAGGEIGALTSSFNSMLDTLQVTQDQLVQSEKLASLGQLAAGVAHELNNPLGTILLYSDILLKEADPASQTYRDLVMIVDETKRCKSIVGSLLEFARQNQVVAKPTDLNALILSVIEVQRKRVEGKSIKIYHELSPSIPKIQADQAQITQVLTNLIENAADALPEGGKIVVRTLNSPAGMVTIEIEDNGMGISPEDQKKLFTPFFTTKPIGRGTGLGLPIVYGIVKMHRGQISVQSNLNQGTTFTIQLPRSLLGMSNVSQSL